MEELMRRLEMLTAKNKKLRAKAKGKKIKGSSFSSEEEDSSFEEDVSKTGKKEEEIMISLPITQCLLITIICLALPLIFSILVGKAPYFDRTSYNQWKYCMKNYLYSISPDVWQVVCDGVDFPDEDEEPTSNQLQQIHRNA
jgi:hypothetical protein